MKIDEKRFESLCGQLSSGVWKGQRPRATDASGASRCLRTNVEWDIRGRS